MPADIALNATEVGEVVLYVAPGFFGQLGYRAKYPAPEPSAGKTLIVSVVLSLPLVALATTITGEGAKPTEIGYVAALIAASFMIGYLLAQVRGWTWVKNVLARVGYHLQPEGSMYAEILFNMAKEASVTVELKDGRRVWGMPRSGPTCQGDGINELYLTYPKAERDGEWQPAGAGLMIPLSEISNIALSEDPTARRSGNDPNPSPSRPNGQTTPREEAG